MALRVIAIDWSGGKRNPGKKIFWAEFKDGKAICPENGYDREQTISKLTDAATIDAVIAGLDFAFSCPAWFLRYHGHSQIGTFWNDVGQRSESWLRECSPPFWGRGGRKCELANEQLFRRTELDAKPVAGITPKSVFQLAGGAMSEQDHYVG